MFFLSHLVSLAAVQRRAHHAQRGLPEHCHADLLRAQERGGGQVDGAPCRHGLCALQVSTHFEYI